jgi:hypothetical protein
MNVPEDRLREVDALLSSDPELVWCPALTATVVSRVRLERRRNAVGMAAAAALILLSVWLGGTVLADRPEVALTGAEISRHLPPTQSMLSTIDAAFTSVSENLSTALSPLDRLPAGPGLPVALAAIVVLLILNGLTLARPALARRRNP